MANTHLIVIDDDSAARDSVSALLEAYGFEVTSFESGEDFLGNKDHIPPYDGLLVDFQLPGMSGRELMKLLKEAEEKSPAILITGYADASLTADAIKTGAAAVLEKPIDPSVLLANLNSLVVGS